MGKAFIQKILYSLALALAILFSVSFGAPSSAAEESIDNSALINSYDILAFSKQCEVVQAHKLHSYNNELARRWQIAFAKDVVKLQTGKARLSRDSSADETNTKLLKSTSKLTTKRVAKLLGYRKSFAQRYKNCLDRATKAHYKNIVAALKGKASENITSIRENIKNNGVAFKKKYKKLSRKVKQGKASKKSLKKLRAHRLQYVLKQKAAISGIKEALQKDLDNAAKARDNRLRSNSETTTKVVKAKYEKNLVSMKTEERPLAKELFRNIGERLAELNKRYVRDPFNYAKAISGAPSVNWKQVDSEPTVSTAPLSALSGREAVQIGKVLAGDGKVLMVGDSIQVVMGKYVKNYLPNPVAVGQRAVGGYNSNQIRFLFNSAYSSKYSIIVFDAGTNDNPNYSSIIRNNLREVAQRVGSDRCIVAPTVNTLSVGGTGASKKNEAIRTFAQHRALTVVPNWYSETRKNPSLLSDKLHPSARGSQVRAKMIADGIKSCVGY